MPAFAGMTESGAVVAGSADGSVYWALRLRGGRRLRVSRMRCHPTGVIVREGGQSSTYHRWHMKSAGGHTQCCHAHENRGPLACRPMRRSRSGCRVFARREGGGRSFKRHGGRWIRRRRWILGPPPPRRATIASVANAVPPYGRHCPRRRTIQYSQVPAWEVGGRLLYHLPGLSASSSAGRAPGVDDCGSSGYATALASAHCDQSSDSA